MNFTTAVSRPSKSLILAPELTPEPLRINKRKRQLSPDCPLETLNIRKQRRGATMSYPPTYVDRNVRREPSFKHRFLSRVMNSLISRPGGSVTAEEGGSRRHSAEVFSTSNAADTSTGRPSISTVDTSTSIDTDLETALSAFPEPPVSNLTSPTEFSAFDQAQADARTDRILCVPAHTAVARPEVSIIPEKETLISDTSQSMYVAVQIGAVTDATAKVPHERTYGLDVAVIIDNSQFTSPATLMASCETARFLSTLLDSSNDRMAIICTSAIHAEDRDFRTVLPLSLPNPRKTKAAVDSIVSSLERPRLSTMDAALRSATALLEHSTPRDPHSKLGPFAFGHVFLLTSNSKGIAPHLLTHDTIQLHLVCAGNVPWQDEGKVRCNGWKIQSMHMNELQCSSRIKDEDPLSLFARLRTTVSDARKGLLHGAVSDLVLDIKPGPNCTIEAIIGTPNIPNLRPGENTVALVRLKVGLPAAGYTLVARRQQDGSSPAYTADLDREIDKLLGTTPVTVLTVKLKYKHSLLPSNTHCTSLTECRMKRRLRTPEWQDVTPKAVTQRHSDPQVEVQKRFAFHIATRHAPRQAMMVLTEDFGDGGRRSVCPDYIKLLIEELKYQARTIERFDLADYRAGPVVATPPELRPDVWGQEHFGHGLFDASNYKPQEWITDVPDEVVVQFPLAPSSKPRTHNRERSGELNSRTVLKREPKGSSRKESGGENRSSGSTEIDEATKRLRSLVLKNKRSLASETLKDLAYPPYRPRAMEPQAL